MADEDEDDAAVPMAIAAEDDVDDDDELCDWLLRLRCALVAFESGRSSPLLDDGMVPADVANDEELVDVEKEEDEEELELVDVVVGSRSFAALLLLSYVCSRVNDIGYDCNTTRTRMISTCGERRSSCA